MQKNIVQFRIIISAKKERRYSKSIGKWQLNVGTVLNKLKNILPGKALCMLALTMTDLYCDNTDLFVTGMSAGIILITQ